MLTRRVSLGLALLLFASASAWAADASSFVGKWEMDKKKTNAAGAPEDLKEEIKQSGNSLIIKSKYQEPKSAMYPLMWVGIMTYELPLSLDGTEKVNQIGPFLHTSKTAIDGKTMTTDFTAAMEGGKVTGKWVRTLSDDGKEMTLQVIAQSSDGRNMDQKLVFRRR